MRSASTLLEAHLGQIRALWLRVLPTHAGLNGLSSLSLEYYRENLSSSSHFPWLRDFHGPDLIPAAIDWMLANAMRDLLSMLLNYIDEIRKLCEICDILRFSLPETERDSLIKERLKRPPTPQDSVARIHALLEGGFPLQQELVTMESLTKLFMAKVAKQDLVDPVTLTLCAQSQDSDSMILGSSLPAVTSVTLTITTLSELDPSWELLERVFYTACMIMRELSLSVRGTFGEVQIPE